jgi:hypothetical protein
MTMTPPTPNTYPPQVQPQPRSGGGCLKVLGCTAAVGCAVVALVLVVAVGAGWWATSWLASHGGGLHSFENVAGEGEVRRLHDQAARLAPFDTAHPPRLTAERLDVYLAVRRALRPELERNRALIQASAQRMQGGGHWSLTDVLDFVRVWGDLKQRHAQVLVAQRMSADEYQYISSRASALFGPTGGVPELSGPVPPTPNVAGVGGPDDAELALLRTRGGDLDWGQDWLIEEMLLTTDFSRFANKASGGAGSTTDAAGR